MREGLRGPDEEGTRATVKESVVGEDGREGRERKGVETHHHQKKRIDQCFQVSNSVQPRSPSRFSSCPTLEQLPEAHCRRRDARAKEGDREGEDDECEPRPGATHPCEPEFVEENLNKEREDETSKAGTCRTGRGVSEGRNGDEEMDEPANTAPFASPRFSTNQSPSQV
jgi:hypothetical protein